MKKANNQKDIVFYGKSLVGPVMLSFTEWIISEAEKKGIKRLYFLARDGYLLYEIAKTVCRERKIDVDCRYLYCSRQALRIPSYHIIGDEAFELLTLGGYHFTKRTILERAAISESEINGIASELDIKELDAPMSYGELGEFKEALKSSELYKKAVIERSADAYDTTIEYFRQEGLFEEENLAIADSGWTGSMQRSLRQLLENEGFKGKLTGFYFGMYVSAKEEADGEYNTFYFDRDSGTKRKATFNNNLFECMLSAPHPMTVRYEQSENGRIDPVFAPIASEKQLNMIQNQIKGALEFVNEIDFSEKGPFVYEKELKKVYKLLKRHMIYPTRSFAEIYGSFAFCDDVTEGYYMTLADSSKRKLLRKYMLFPRILKKLFKLRIAEEGELFWPYGVIAFCPAILRPWYRFNIRAWEILKAILHK